MEFVDKLLQETDFLQQLKKLEQLEKNREFCRHGLNHLLDTARIMWITYLEEQKYKDKIDVPTNFIKENILDKEMIYLAALLHDLGRIREYEDGISHHIASADMAEAYLVQISYPVENAKIIVSAVYGHRRKQRKSLQNLKKACGENGDVLEKYQKRSEFLEEILYLADKKSRTCFYCEAAETCNWKQEKRNVGIIV